MSLPESSIVWTTPAATLFSASARTLVTPLSPPPPPTDATAAAAATAAACNAPMRPCTPWMYVSMDARAPSVNGPTLSKNFALSAAMRSSADAPIFSSSNLASAAICACFSTSASLMPVIRASRSAPMRAICLVRFSLSMPSLNDCNAIACAWRKRRSSSARARLRIVSASSALRRAVRSPVATSNRSATALRSTSVFALARSADIFRTRSASSRARLSIRSADSCAALRSSACAVCPAPNSARRPRNSRDASRFPLADAI